MIYYKKHTWNVDKNEKLKKIRGVSFEDIMQYISQGNLLDIIEHPNTDRYGNLKMYVLDIQGYIYLVPFVESDEEIFMKTIIPSRKATKKYREEI